MACRSVFCLWAAIHAASSPPARARGYWAPGPRIESSKSRTRPRHPDPIPSSPPKRPWSPRSIPEFTRARVLPSRPTTSRRPGDPWRTDAHPPVRAHFPRTLEPEPRTKIPPRLKPFPSYPIPPWVGRATYRASGRDTFVLPRRPSRDSRSAQPQIVSLQSYRDVHRKSQSL